MSIRGIRASAAIVAVALLLSGCTFPFGIGTQPKPTPPAEPTQTSAQPTTPPPADVSTVTQEQSPPPLEKRPANGAPAGSAMHKPGFDSAERKAILDALRPAIEGALKQKVVFKVDKLRVMDGFAFLQAQPLQPNEKPIDYSKTQYADAYNAGAFDDRVDALLRWNGERWRVVKWDLGATDVVWEPWPDETGAPADLFEP